MRAGGVARGVAEGYLYLTSECVGSTNQLGIPLEMQIVAQSA